MIGYNWEGLFSVRPFAKQVLTKLYQYFDLYLFTAADKKYADQVLNIIDPKAKIFRNRFYREDCVEIQQFRVKDLRMFQDRDLQNIIIVDNSVISFAFQLNNGIPILPYEGEEDDCELIYLLKFLDRIKDAKDVRIEIKKAFNIKQYL